MFLDLRERRNALRRSLPQLIAEQSVTHSRQDSVRWAQEVLQHCSTVMSSCRDLSALLQHQDKLTPALSESMQGLQQLGSERLKALGQDVSVRNDAWSRVRLALNEAVDASLLESDGSPPLPTILTISSGAIWPAACSCSCSAMPWIRSPVHRRSRA